METTATAAPHPAPFGMGKMVRVIRSDHTDGSRVTVTEYELGYSYRVQRSGASCTHWITRECWSQGSVDIIGLVHETCQRKIAGLLAEGGRD